MDIKSCAVGAVTLLQKSSIVFQRFVLHEVCADNQAAVSVIEANAQGFINDLMGKLGLREEGLLFAFLLWRKITAVHEGNLLLIIAGWQLDPCIQEIGALLNKIGGQLRNNTP